MIANGETQARDKYQLFDPLPDEDYERLKADIRERGVLVPVELDEDGNILDGHHRVRAWKELKAEGVNLADFPRMLRPSMSEEEKRNHVRALNILRRHLTKEQRAEVMADMRRDGMTLQQIATAVNVSVGTVHNTLSSFSELKNSETPMTTVGKDGKSYPATKQRKVGTPGITVKNDRQQQQVQAAIKFVDTSTGEILDAHEATRDHLREKREQTRRERAGKAAELSSAFGRYGVIYADPPWRYEHAPANNRVIENHYPTMSLEEICALPVSDIRHEEAALFLWATSPKLHDALNVIEAWGFDYRTCMVWVKDRVGMGYYVRQQHELLLIATCGNMTTPPEGARPSSVFHAPRLEHSRKPDLVYDLIERMYPEYRKVELFARRAREGWEAWGNENT
jgi:N6-adenosine-specific RNA methylase IME4